MQGKFKIKKNNIRVSSKKSTVSDASLSISRKTFTDGMQINIITSNMVDTSNSHRVLSPIQAQRRKQMTTGVISKTKKRRAVRNLTLKSAPPIPTAPKDPIVRKKMWVMSEIKSLLKGIDIYFAITAILLSIIGLFAVNSASNSFGSSRFVIIQFAGMLLGIVIAIIISITDYRLLFSKYRYIIGINAAILLITFIFGSSVTDATNANWIDLGFIKIQPSEFAKLLFIFSFAVHLGQVRDKMHKLSTVFSLAIHAGVIFSLVLLQKDLGSLTIFAAIFVSMCFAAGMSIWYYITGAAFMLCASPFLWARLSSYQRDRILLCFDSSIDPAGTGIRYQQLRSCTAIGNGGIMGKGYMQGTVTQGINGHLPAKHTDMIYSTICEEFGFIGAVIVLLITCLLIYRIIRIAMKCANTTGTYICVGIASMFMIQVVENVGMCLGIMPVIGITYPLLSYGGSSVLSCFIAIGMVLSVCTHSEKTFFS